MGNFFIILISERNRKMSISNYPFFIKVNQFYKAAKSYCGINIRMESSNLKDKEEKIETNEFETNQIEINESIEKLQKQIEKIKITPDDQKRKSIDKLKEKKAEKKEIEKEKIDKKIETKIEEEKWSKRFLYKKRRLNTEEKQLLEKTFGRYDREAVISEFDNHSITVRDIRCLSPRTWLNDEVINFYMGILQKRSNVRKRKANGELFFNTFFFTTLSGGETNQYNYNKVRRWTKRKKIDIFGLDKVFVPININDSHWTLDVIDIGKKKICYLDSYHNPYEKAFDCLQKYLFDEHLDKKGECKNDWLKFKHERWTNIPQQLNSYDCGVFVCKAAEFISDKMPLK